MITNPNNYVGISSTIVGYLASDPRPPAYDKDGSKGVIEVSIPIDEGYKKDGEFVQTGTTWYTYLAAGDYANTLKGLLHKGDKVRIDDARQEVREFKTKDGSDKLGIGLRFGTVTVLESRDQGEANTDVPF